MKWPNNSSVCPVVCFTENDRSRCLEQTFAPLRRSIRRIAYNGRARRFPTGEFSRIPLLCAPSSARPRSQARRDLSLAAAPDPLRRVAATISMNSSNPSEACEPGENHHVGHPEGDAFGRDPRSQVRPRPGFPKAKVGWSFGFPTICLGGPLRQSALFDPHSTTICVHSVWA